MKRRIAIIIVFPLLGAIVNVAVAWACALSPGNRGITTYILTQQGEGFIAKYSHNASAGWPVRSMQWRSSERPFEATQDEISSLSDEQELLPMRPRFPGFAINTLFYALLLWLLFFVPFTARRMLRRRRGQCEKGAYPIGVSPVCTECGAAVRRRGSAMA